MFCSKVVKLPYLLFYMRDVIEDRFNDFIHFFLEKRIMVELLPSVRYKLRYNLDFNFKNSRASKLDPLGAYSEAH